MFAPAYTDVTSWPVMEYLQTGGTREKCWVMDPKDGKLYFFKVSIKKDVIDYQSEFWMEIIASKFGQSLGLKMLDYNIARKDEKVGCLSANMCEEGYDLVELTRLLTGCDATYNPASKEDQERYTFSFVCKALRQYRQESHIGDFIRVLVFDSLIGNQDRHQDNWGFIKPTAETVIERKSIFGKKSFQIVSSWQQAKFSPVYDSGSCLGRELSEEKVRQMLTDNNQLDAYVRRGKAELRWNKDKLSYFDLLEKLLDSKEYSQQTRDIIQELLGKYDCEALKEIVENVDKSLPDEVASYRLSEERKAFVIKLVKNRVEGLKKLSQYGK